MLEATMPDLPAYGRHVTEVVSHMEVTDRFGNTMPLVTGTEQLLTKLRETKMRGAKALFIGNGGSAAIASHQAADFWKTGQLRALAFNDPCLLTSVSNDCGYPEVFATPIAMFADPGDLLIAISSSGASENILRGAIASRRKQCFVVTLSGFAPDNPLRTHGDLNFYVPAEEYGLVELSHLMLCHYLLDRFMADSQWLSSTRAATTHAAQSV